MTTKRCTRCNMASQMFGWELSYRLVENDITKKEDVLVALLHWYFIKCGFRCIGLGDSKSFSSSDVGSEALPKDWSSGGSYALRYVLENELYILKGVRSEADIVLNFLRVSDLTVSIIHFKVEDTVKNLKGDIEALIPNYKSVLDTMQKELLEPVVTGTKKEATTQTAQPSTRSEPIRPGFQDNFEPTRPGFQDNFDPLRIGQPRRGVGVGFDSNWDPNRDPLAVGRSDLDPFSRGGGMIFNPFGPRGGIRDPGAGVPGGLPRGSIPPGARFDPFGPPGVGPRRDPPGPPGSGFGAPNPDHLPPPGYDDMFM